MTSFSIKATDLNPKENKATKKRKRDEQKTIWQTQKLKDESSNAT